MSLPTGQPGPDGNPDAPALARGHDLHRFELTTHRARGAWMILPVKRVLRRLLHQVLSRQADFNVEVHASLQTLQVEIRSLLNDLHALRRVVEAGERQPAEQAALETRLSALERKLAPPAALQLPLERFRGSEQVISERQQRYVPLFQGRTDVLDLGCGRGEFLELMRGSGIAARGIELDPALVSHCSARGLTVTQAEAVSYLADCLPESLGGIFAAQLIEHLAVDDLARMVALASTRLRPGGVLVLETVNPLCFTSLSSFWLDPTHVRPLHPALLLWLAEREGLGGLEIVEATRADPALLIPALDGIQHGNVEQFNEGIERVNETLFGAQDYALVARRPE